MQINKIVHLLLLLKGLNLWKQFQPLQLQTLRMKLTGL